MTQYSEVVYVFGATNSISKWLKTDLKRLPAEEGKQVGVNSVISSSKQMYWQVHIIDNSYGSRHKTLIAIEANSRFTVFIPASVKHQLVFLRRKNALPGHRFLQLAEHDQRIDLLRLKQQVQPLVQLNVTEEQQNRVWYQHIYHPHQNAPLVKSAHKAFLQWRDSMVVSMFIALLLAVGVQTVSEVAVAFSPFSFLVSVTFALATGLAAHHSGKRMVTNAVVLWLLKPEAFQQ